MTSHVNSIRSNWANEARKNNFKKNISWQIAKGDKWILYGLNGAGKTTLLNILNAYELRQLAVLIYLVKCQAR